MLENFIVIGGLIFGVDFQLGNAQIAENVGHTVEVVLGLPMYDRQFLPDIYGCLGEGTGKPGFREGC